MAEKRYVSTLNKAGRQIVPESRKQWQKWYQSREWKQLRKEHLSENPYCEMCIAEGKRLAQCVGNVVDHRIPHKGQRGLFASPSNLRTLCKPHHSSKTCREDGGFGNRVRRDR